jgi:hypothetical protein
MTGKNTMENSKKANGMQKYREHMKRLRMNIGNEMELWT